MLATNIGVQRSCAFLGPLFNVALARLPAVALGAPRLRAHGVTAADGRLAPFLLLVDRHNAAAAAARCRSRARCGARARG